MAVFHYCAMVRHGPGVTETVASLMTAPDVTEDGAVEWMQNTRQEIASVFEPPVDPCRVVVLSLSRIGG